MTVGERVRTLGQPAPRFTNRRHLLILHFNESACSPAATLGHRRLVGGEIERDEEEEVGGEDADAGDGGEFLAGAFAIVGEPGPVSAGEVGPGGEVDEA